jgi:hypothetical protein
MHTENATPLVKPTAEKGKIVTQTSQATQAGNERTVEETTIPKDQTETSVDFDAFKSTKRILHTENPSSLVATVPDGYAGRKENAPTKAGNTQTIVETHTPRARTVSYISRKSDRETENTERGHNADSIPEISDNEIIDGDINSLFKYNYVKKTKTPQIPKSCATPVSWTTKGRPFWKANNYRQVNPQVVYDYTWVNSAGIYRWDETHTVSFHLTAAEAALAIAAATSEITEGSHIRDVGDNLWMAHKVVHTLVCEVLYGFKKPEINQSGVLVVYKEE